MSLKCTRRYLLCLGLIVPTLLSAQTYRVIDLGVIEDPLDDTLLPFAIDDQGTVWRQPHPLLDCEDCSFELPVGVAGTVTSVEDRRALAVSDNGQYAAGYGAVQANLWTDGLTGIQALMAQGGTLHILGTLCEDQICDENERLGFSEAFAVNNLGQVAGHAEASGNGPAWLVHSFVWQDGVMERIVPPVPVDIDATEFSSSRAVGINNNGQVIGHYAPLLNLDSGDLGPDRAYLWQEGVTVDLPHLPEHGQAAGQGYAGARDINDNGLVVGWSSVFETQGMTAVLWSNDSVTSLGTLEPEAPSIAVAINNPGQVIGWSGNRVFLWQEGEMQDLSQLLTAEDAAWEIRDPLDINNQGMILARADLDGVPHAVVLEPVTAPGEQPPEVSIEGGDRTIADTDGVAGEAVSFTATAMPADEEGEIVTTEWLIDGSVVASGLSAELLLPDGETAVSFRAVDDLGVAAETAVLITVQPPVPVGPWPALYEGTSPDPALGLPYNNIGFFDPARDLIFSCARIETDGLPDVWQGMPQVGVAMAIISLEEGIVEVVDTRPFNEAGALTEAGETPACSGVLETTTNTYQDIIELEGETWWVRFELIDTSSDLIQLRLVDALPATESLWPAPYSGVTPDPALGLPFNNIGVLNPADGLVYSCVRVYTGGVPSDLDGTSRIDVALEILSVEEGIVQVVRSRPFNAGGALNEAGEAPDCSGVYETDTMQYRDLIQYDFQTLEAEFELIDEEALRLQLQQLRDLTPPAPAG